MYHRTVDLKLVPKLQMFSGQLQDGAAFLKGFKARTVGLNDESCIANFRALLTGEAGEWFDNKRFSSWEDLEKLFYTHWCITYSPWDAMCLAQKLEQGNDESLMAFTLKFKKYRKFFKKLVDNSIVIDLFISCCRPAIKGHAFNLKMKKLSWDSFVSLE